MGKYATLDFFEGSTRASSILFSIIVKQIDKNDSLLQNSIKIDCCWMFVNWHCMFQAKNKIFAKPSQQQHVNISRKLYTASHPKNLRNLSINFISMTIPFINLELLRISVRKPRSYSTSSRRTLVACGSRSSRSLIQLLEVSHCCCTAQIPPIR